MKLQDMKKVNRENLNILELILCVHKVHTEHGTLKIIKDYKNETVSIELDDRNLQPFNLEKECLAV